MSIDPFLGFDDWTNSIWTSGNDLGEQGQYTCATTGKHISAEMLKNEHIDNHNHGVCMIEHCLALVRKPANLFIFNDDLCSRLRYFLCEERKLVDHTPRVSGIENESEEDSLSSLEEVPDNKSGSGLRRMPPIFYSRKYGFYN